MVPVGGRNEVPVTSITSREADLCNEQNGNKDFISRNENSSVRKSKENGEISLRLID